MGVSQDLALNQIHRISVVGAVGCGKTTLARLLAKQLQLPHFELDTLKYGPEWSEVPDRVFASRVAQLTQTDRWVIDGNYELVRQLIWQRADFVVWLDYSLALVLWRLFSRTVYRLLIREKFANGNRERLSRILSPNSIIVWAVQSHKARRRHFEKQLCEPRYRHLLVQRLKSPRAVANLFAQLSRVPNKGAT